MCSLQSDWPATSKSYKLLGPLGSGYFGIVWRAEVTEGAHKGEHVAIKKIDLERYGDQKIEEIRKNMLLLNLLDNPNILSYKIAFLHKQELWLVFELMEGGSIEKLMRTMYPEGLKDQSLIATILRETLLGLKYLHQNSQIHRDIKGGNVLISADGSIKISDFGVTAKLKKGKKRCTLIGSPCYMAPEILDQESQKGYDSKVDIWSLGITALELAYGQPPNSELTTMKLIMKTLNEEPPKLVKGPNYDESLAEFINFCLVKDPNQRKSADDLLKSCANLFKKAKGKDYIKEKLLKNLPKLEDRLDAHTKQLAMEQLKEDQNKKSSLLNFDFTCQKIKEKENNKNNEALFAIPQLKKACSNTLPYQGPTTVDKMGLTFNNEPSYMVAGRASVPAKSTNGFNNDITMGNNENYYYAQSTNATPISQQQPQPTQTNFTSSLVSSNGNSSRIIKDLRTCAQQTTLDKISRSQGDMMYDDFSITNEEEC
jgi:serine/threonine-protein kinase OSR1/STK39